MLEALVAARSHDLGAAPAPADSTLRISTTGETTTTLSLAGTLEKNPQLAEASIAKILTPASSDGESPYELSQRLARERAAAAEPEPGMKGFIRDCHLAEAEEAFPGITRYYAECSPKPKTFLDLVRRFNESEDSRA